MLQGLRDRELGGGYYLVWPVGAGVLLYRLVRVAVVERTSGLVVRNVFSTRRVAWADIEDIAVLAIPGTGYTAAVGVRIKGKRFRRTVSATTCYTKARADAINASIVARAATNGITCQLDPYELRSEVL